MNRPNGAGAPFQSARSRARDPMAADEAPTAEQAAALLEELERGLRGGGVPLRFAVEHAGAGDPLPGAWSACTDDVAMFAALHRAGLHSPPGTGAGWSVCPRHREVRRSSEGYVGCPDCVALIRAHVPTLTLADVLAAARGAR